MAEQLIVGMSPTISHLLSPKQHNMIRVVCIPLISMKRKLLTKARGPKIHVRTCTHGDQVHFPSCAPCVAMYYNVHTRVDADTAYNGIV